MNSKGIEYLSALKTYYSGFSKTSISSRYVSFMVTGMGSYCTMIALMECSLGLRKKENKIYAVALLAMGLSGIAIGSILQWQNVNLVIPLVAASSLLGLLVIFQLIGSRN
jgi:hypothetical protein